VSVQPVSAEPFTPRRSPSTVARKVFVYLLLLLISLVFFVPFIWTVTTSFKTLPDTVVFNLIPHQWTTAAWHSVWVQYSFATFIKNSFFLAIVITAANVFLAALGGYAFARLRFPGRELIFLLVLGTLMIPDQLRLIPVFVMLTNWRLIGNFSGYILINLVTAVNLFFMRQYFLTIPAISRRPRSWTGRATSRRSGASCFRSRGRVLPRSRFCSSRAPGTTSSGR